MNLGNEIVLNFRVGELPVIRIYHGTNIVYELNPTSNTSWIFSGDTVTSIPDNTRYIFDNDVIVSIPEV